MCRRFRARRTGAGCGASACRSAHKADCPAVLGSKAPRQNSLRSRRSLRSDNCREHVDEARCARGPHPLRSSATRRRATAHPRPPTRTHGGAPRARMQRAIRAPSRPSQQQRGSVRGAFGSGEKRRGGVGARSAHPRLTRRSCLSAAPWGREASSAARPCTEHRSGVGRQADRSRRHPGQAPAAAERAQAIAQDRQPPTTRRPKGRAAKGTATPTLRSPRIHFGRVSITRRALPRERSMPSGSSTSTRVLTPISVLMRCCSSRAMAARSEDANAGWISQRTSTSSR